MTSGIGRVDLLRFEDALRVRASVFALAAGTRRQLRLSVPIVARHELRAMRNRRDGAETGTRSMKGTIGEAGGRWTSCSHRRHGQLLGKFDALHPTKCLGNSRCFHA